MDGRSGHPPAFLMLFYKMTFGYERSRPGAAWNRSSLCSTKHTEIAINTLDCHLKKAGASPKDLIQSQTAKGFRRLEAEDVHLMWKFDFRSP
jgi:hypothetical protein